MLFSCGFRILFLINTFFYLKTGFLVYYYTGKLIINFKMARDDNAPGENIDMKYLISARKNNKTSVTKTYNDRNNFTNYDDIKRN